MALFTITHKYLNNSEMIEGFQYLYVGAYRQPERRKIFFMMMLVIIYLKKTAIIVN